MTADVPFCAATMMATAVVLARCSGHDRTAVLAVQDSGASTHGRPVAEGGSAFFGIPGNSNRVQEAAFGQPET